MPMTTINIRRFAGVQNGQTIKHWYLDDPKIGIISETKKTKIKVRGWVVLQRGHVLEYILIKQEERVLQFKLSEKRADVARRFESLGAPNDAPVLCGFNFEVEFSKFRIGFQTSNGITWGASIEAVTTLKVERGRDGWLFLSNDTNKSMEQYTGRRLLDDNELSLWENYFSLTRKLSEEHSFKHCFLLAPAKEFCLEDFYPATRGAYIAIDQFLMHFAKKNTIVWPRDQLLRDKELTYWKGDTHWSDYGGYVAAMVVLEKLGLKPKAEVPPVSYSIVRRSGDLGGKLSPPETFAVPTAEFSQVTTNLVFDNTIHNHGRIRIYEESSPIYPEQSCVCFGDSFSVNMIPWLIPYFNRLVYVHSAAAFDREVLEYETPTHVIFQTNSRFIITPPHASGNLRESVLLKLKLLTFDKRQAFVKELEKQRSRNTKNTYYYDFMLSILNSISSNLADA
jgi:hypothetical protein